jgi:cyclic pyranopterin phosphate synthase
MSRKPKENPGTGLSHIASGAGERAEACMVDVGGKPVTARSALARARVVFPSGVLAEIRSGAGPKGSLEALLETARTAAILAAKRTGELIPMCHPLGLDFVEVLFEVTGEDTLEVRCRAACTGRTGVEMEAMCGASLAALTIYDMTKALTKGIRVESLELLEKSGGKSGLWTSESA